MNVELVLQLVGRLTVMLALFFVVERLFPRQNSGYRHLVWRIAVVAMLLLPVASLLLPPTRIPVATATVPEVRAVGEPARVVTAISQPSAAESAPLPSTPTKVRSTSVGRSESSLVPSGRIWPTVSWTHAVVVIYVAGLLVGMLRLALGAWQVRSVRRSSQVVSGPWRTELDRMSQRLGLRRTVELRAVGDLPVPSQIGVLRPSVLLPTQMLQSADPVDDRIRAAVAHELVHAQRSDTLFQLLAGLCEAVYWCHPLVWLATRRLRDMSEQVCDDTVVELLGNSDGYARTLLDVARNAGGRGLVLGAGMARSTKIESRLRRILTLGGNVSPRTGRLAATVFVGGLGVWMVLVATGSVTAALAESEPDMPPIGRTAFAVPLTSPITIDGDLADWSDYSPVNEVRENTGVYGPTDLQGTDLDTSEDFSPSFRVAYDSERVYVAIVMRDDRLHVAEGTVRATDAGEINLGGPAGAPIICHHLVPGGGGGYFSVGNPAAYAGDWDDERSGDELGVDVAFRRTGDINVYEWSIPVRDAHDQIVTLTSGMVLPFDVVAVDADGPDDNSAWIAWTPNRGKHQMPNVGRLVLAPSTVGSLTISASDAEGSVAGARFEIWQGKDLLMADVTDHAGWAEQWLPAGRYRLRWNSHGFETAEQEVDIRENAAVQVAAQLTDLGTRFHVDDDAGAEGDGSLERPFRTIQQAFGATSYGDTVQLAAGTYADTVELISGVTILGAGEDRTVITGESAWGLALRPFVAYYERPGGPDGGYWRVKLRDIEMGGFTVDAGSRFPKRPAREVAATLNMMMAIDRDDADAVRRMLRADPSLASMRIHSPDAPKAGSTFLHRIVTVYTNASDAEYEIARLLIEHGADVNARGGQARGWGRTAIGYAGFFGNPRLVRLYLANGGVPDAEVLAGTAHEGSHVDDPSVYIPTFEALVDAGGEYDLGHLILLSHTEWLSRDLENNPDLVNQPIPLRHAGARFGTPLYEAIEGCNVPIARLLLERGASFVVNDRGVTAPPHGLSCGPEMMSLLAEFGADVGLLAATVMGDEERVADILEREPEQIHRRHPENGWSALDMAVEREYDEIEAMLRKAGGTFGQRVEAMVREATPDDGVYSVLSQVDTTRGHPGYMHIDNSQSLDIREQITLAAWIYRVDDGGGAGTVIGKWRQLGESWSYVLHLPGDGFHLRWEDETQSHMRDFWLPYHEWAHYAATYDGQHMRVFVNGELVSESPVEGKRINSTDNPVWIGSSGYHDHTSAILDDVQIWNTARTEAQIRQSMAQGLRGDEEGLVGWWPMEGGRPLEDRSPYGNHGRLEGSAVVHNVGTPVDDGHADPQALWILPLKEAAPR